jgi:catechol 2,3-dioxygenase-like lactoylglutathione lyase family enzyme
MKMVCALALGVLGIGFAQAQPAPASPEPAGPPPTGVIIGSGNYFSPIVANLDAAVAFYRDGLGLDVQGAPGDANANLPLRNMFGLPDATLRWQIARSPAAPGGVEIIEVTSADGKTVDRRFDNVGAATLVAVVRDLDATRAKLAQLGARVVTRGGQPIVGASRARSIVFKDPAGHFVQLVQPAQLPVAPTSPTANVAAVVVNLTVADIRQSIRLYADALGLKVLRAPTVPGAAGFPAMFDVGAEPIAVATLQVPTSGILIELVEFANASRVQGRIQDPGSTRMQLRVNDIDEAIAAFKRFGGEVVSTGGVPLDLPAGNGVLKVAIVRDPNNLFVVLIQAPPPAA